MKKLVVAIAAAAGVLVAGFASAQQAGEIKVIEKESLKYTFNPVVGVLVAQVSGTSVQSGSLYVLYAKYEAGVKSVPHTHPDQRVVTVLSGTFYAGSGPEFDEKMVRPLPPGSILVIPPNTVHWGWAKDGEVILEEVGIGPSGTTVWPKAPPK